MQVAAPPSPVHGGPGLSVAGGGTCTLSPLPLQWPAVPATRHVPLFVGLGAGRAAVRAAVGGPATARAATAPVARPAAALSVRQLTETETGTVARDAGPSLRSGPFRLRTGKEHVHGHRQDCRPFDRPPSPCNGPQSRGPRVRGIPIPHHHFRFSQNLGIPPPPPVCGDSQPCQPLLSAPTALRPVCTRQKPPTAFQSAGNRCPQPPLKPPRSAPLRTAPPGTAEPASLRDRRIHLGSYRPHWVRRGVWGIAIAQASPRPISGGCAGASHSLRSPSPTSNTARFSTAFGSPW